MHTCMPSFTWALSFALLCSPRSLAQDVLCFSSAYWTDIDVLRLSAPLPPPCSVFYVLNNPPKGWQGGKGFVTADMIK